MVVIEVPEGVVRAAMAEPALAGRVFLNSRNRHALVVNGVCAGFVTPHATKLAGGGWRAGPIFVLPEYRGRGLVEAFYTENRDRTWVAFIAHNNTASLLVHRRAGFVDWRRSKHGRWLRLEADHGEA